MECWQVWFSCVVTLKVEPQEVQKIKINSAVSDDCAAIYSIVLVITRLVEVQSIWLRLRREPCCNISEMPILRSPRGRRPDRYGIWWQGSQPYDLLHRSRVWSVRLLCKTWGGEEALEQLMAGAQWGQQGHTCNLRWPYTSGFETSWSTFGAHPRLMVEKRFLCNVIDTRTLIGPCSHVTLRRWCHIWYSGDESSSSL